MIMCDVIRSEHIEREERSYSFILKQNHIVGVGNSPPPLYFIVSHSFLHIYQSSLTLAAALLLLNMN